MNEIKGVLITAAAAVAFYVGVKTAYKVASNVVESHIPFGHCAEAVGYNYDDRCHPKTFSY